MDFSKIRTPQDVEEFFKGFQEEMFQRMRREQMQKVRNYRVLNQVVEKGQILFTGSSLMEQFPICELCQSLNLDKKVYNRGIGGTVTEDFLREIDTVLLDLEPSKVFINIGTNDMNPAFGEDWMEKLLSNYEEILKRLKDRLPGAEVYVMAYYPVNDVYAGTDPGAAQMLKVRTPENLALVNSRIEELAGRMGCSFINVNEGLTDTEGKLKQEYTVEGVHMYAEGYLQVFENLKKYILE